MKTKKDILADVVFLAVLAAVLIVLTVSAAGTSLKEMPQESVPHPQVSPTVEALEEEATEPTPEETRATETTEPEAVLFDVPLDASLQEHIIRKAEEQGIDPAIVVAMAYKESTYNHAAVGDGGNSYGLLQVQPRYHYGRMQRLHCTDLLDPYQNVTVAVDYLGELLEQYGSIDKALTAYNRGSYNGTVTEYAKTVMVYAEGLVR